MMLRMSRRYDSASDSILFANNRVYNRDSYKVAGMSEIVEDLLHFCRQMFALSIDNVEYALLTAIVIFSGEYNLFLIIQYFVKINFIINITTFLSCYRSARS